MCEEIAVHRTIVNEKHALFKQKCLNFGISD